MARRKASSPPSPIPIGNCEVLIEANNFTLNKSDEDSLQISISNRTKIKILVRKEASSSFNNVNHSNSEEYGNGKKAPAIRNDYLILLVNPKSAESCTKSYLQKVLALYTTELPTMNYAANTGKQSKFLETCVSNGKYCTLLLRSPIDEDTEEVLAAITYQIVPADMQYAEIPVAAVSSAYQHKGLGCYLYMELKRRLQDVGIRSIFCWGDKQSEGFWLKQGFISLAEVDGRGRARRLPIKANIRKSLSLPGGSTLMVSHLSNEASATTGSLKSCFSLNPCDKSSFQRIADEVPKQCTCSQGAKRKLWEASISSLKTKKVKGSHQDDCNSDSNLCIGSENDRYCSCFNSGSPKDIILQKDTTEASLSGNFLKHNMQQAKTGSTAVETQNNWMVMSHIDGFRIMLMNIADETKKALLTRVIDSLGGSVVSDGGLSTHIVTGKARRTVNFCTALCSGAWIVSPSWLKESFKRGHFVDEMPYILNDEDYEPKYRTELKTAVLRARERPRALLEGYSFCITAHVQPPVATLSAIIWSAGGKILSRYDKVSDVSRTIAIACVEDMEEALGAAKRGIRTFNSEWLITCAMRQELDLDASQFAEPL